MRILLKHRLVSGIFLLLSIVYIGVSLFAHQDPAVMAKYHLTHGKLVALLLTITLPYVLIWFVSLLGYARFSTYAQTIRQSKDGAAFKTMARGLLLLALWLPVSAVTGVLSAKFYQAHPLQTAKMIIIVNYVNIAFLFPGFILTYQGARKLLPLIKTSATTLSQAVNIGFICFSGFYVFLTLEDPARHFPTDVTSKAAYYLPDWLIVFTLVIPRLIMWYLGVKAVQYLYLYRNKVKGTLYKQALNNLARGFMGVVITTIILRCFQSLSAPLARLNLAALLLIVYALLIIIAIGYGLISLGAKKLQQIEDL